MHKTSPK